jgi:hypothetical protein
MTKGYGHTGEPSAHEVALATHRSGEIEDPEFAHNTGRVSKPVVMRS